MSMNGEYLSMAEACGGFDTAVADRVIEAAWVTKVATGSEKAARNES